MRVRSLVFVAALMTASELGSGASGSISASVSDSPCRSSSDIVCIGQSGSQRSFNVRIGETVEVAFGDSSLVWSNIRQVGPQLLRVTHRATRGVEWFREIFEPVAMGHTTLQAIAAPRCSAGQACPQFVLLWQARVVVTR